MGSNVPQMRFCANKIADTAAGLRVSIRDKDYALARATPKLALLTSRLKAFTLRT